MTLIITAAVFFATAGLADAAKDKILFHYDKSIFKNFKNQQFWDSSVSWTNKYKDYDKGDLTAKFPLSKTILVGFTDGFHLTKLINEVSLFIGFLVLSFASIQDINNIIHTIISYSIYKGCFQLGFGWVFAVKDELKR